MMKPSILLISSSFLIVLSWAQPEQGKVIREIVVSLKRTNPETLHLPVALYMGLIETESSFRTNVSSKNGACGLTQLMPRTFLYLVKKYGIHNFDIWDVRNNLYVGLRYFTELIDRYGYVDGIMAYNMGIGNIHKGRTNYDYLIKVITKSFKWII